MTTLDTAAHVTDAAARWSLGLDRLVARLIDWQDARLTRRSLSRLSSRQLDDIGLCRADIAEVARRPR